MRRIRISFWVAVATAIVATGSLSSSLGDPASSAAGVKVGLSGLVVLVSVGVAMRILLALTVASGTSPSEWVKGNGWS